MGNSAPSPGAWPSFSCTGTSGVVPWVELTAAGAEPQTVVTMTMGPTAGTSKGGSLSSGGSCSDPSWGVELTDGVFDTSSPGAAAQDPGWTSWSRGWTEDSGVGDSLVHQDHAATADSSPYSILQGAESTLDGRSPPRCHGNACKDFPKSRMKRLSNWTGSLSRKKRRIQEPSTCDSAHISSHLLPVVHHGVSWNLDQNLDQNHDAQRQNIYNNFVQDLEMDRSCSTTEVEEEEDEEEEEEEQEEEQEEEVMYKDSGGGGERLGALLLEEQGVVRRAGWLSFKPLMSVTMDGKLQAVARRHWRRCWVTLRGCSLLMYDTHGGGVEAAPAPRRVLPAHGALVQPVPEHARREHVFCLSNAHGDVHLLQASSHSDLENWVRAVHSAGAALLARRAGEGDTAGVLRRRCISLRRRIDADGKMKKMAELQLSVIKEAKNRGAVESQILQWDQNLERLNLDLFRFRCYLCSLQGGELPNPKSLLAAAGRPSKSMLGRLGLFSVSSFHALVCSRGEATPPAAGNHRRRTLDGLRGRSSQCAAQSMERSYSLYQTFPECRAADTDVPQNPYDQEAELQPPSPAHLSICQRLRRVIKELVDTEESYVKDLVCLFEVYLSPLHSENFLSPVEMEALFGSLPQMLDFQKVFLQTLQERISACPNFYGLESPEQFKDLLLALAGSFLSFADHFKLYSGFCCTHMKVQKVLEQARSHAPFRHFLESRNPTNQHSSSLESYLIKPVQRVLKYPLMLQELQGLSQEGSPPHTQLTEALRAMQKVARHINEMQKIYEEYGDVFEQLGAEQSGRDQQVAETSMGEFVLHSSVVWMNPLPRVGRVGKETRLTLFVFRRAVVLVYRASCKLRKRMTVSRSADLDPFRFRWLIPVSAIEVRPASITGSGDSCVWELVHCRPEVEGPPEIVFQLCSSGVETKANILRALHSLLRERAPGASFRRKPPSAGEHGAPWRRRQQCLPSEEETRSEPPLPSHASSSSTVRRRRRRRRRSPLGSLTGELEAQLQRLCFSEQEVLRRSHGGEAQDLSAVLERDFSIQSLSSIINEECFYDSATTRTRPATAALHV